MTRVQPYNDVTWASQCLKSPQVDSLFNCHDSKVHGARMGPTWGRQDPGGPHVGHVNLAIWVCIEANLKEKIEVRFTGPLCGESTGDPYKRPVTRKPFPLAETISIRWRHYEST